MVNKIHKIEIDLKKSDERCAPGKKHTDGSCFSKEQLEKITNQVNKHYNMKIDINQPKKNLLRELNKVFKNKYDCDDQLCWLELDVVKDLDDTEINEFTFRPSGPDRGNKWLSNFDIDKVLKQYEKIYNDFISFGAMPNDFQEIKFLDINKNENNFNNLVNRGKYRLGMVFNHDNSNMGGSHWVALYVNLNKGQIYYFDSYGLEPKKEVKIYINKVIDFFNKTNKKYNFEINKIRHQYKNSECGVYSINFILRLLKGETFDFITNHITKDDDVNLCRREYFT